MSDDELLPLEKVLTRWVSPGLKSAGFSKTGKTYRRQDPNGNWAIINFQGTIGTHPQRPERVFFVNIGIAVRAHLDLMDVVFARPERPRADKPEFSGALWTERIYPPEDVEYEPGDYRDQRWWYGDSEGAQRVREHLERILPRQALPQLTRLVDRQELLAEIGDHVAPRGLVTLLIDDGPSQALDAALEQCRQAGDQLVIDWALARLQSQAQPPTA